jgi:hypothetical protein
VEARRKQANPEGLEGIRNMVEPSSLECAKAA